MTADRGFRPHPLRWVLVVLTVIASFAFLTRQADGNGAGLPDMMARTAPAPAGARHVAVSDMRTVAAHDRDCGGASIPDSPAAPHGHAAHCVFCFTAAFALEAAVIDLRTPLPGRVARVAEGYVRPFVRPDIYADARAPPAA